MPSSSPEQIPVGIHVKTLIDHSGSQETFELTTVGRYYKKDNSFFLQYEEVSEEGKIKTIVKIAGKDALILRSGSVKMRMAFRLDEELNGSYETQYGTLQTSALAKELLFQDLINGAGSLELRYDLTMHGSKAGTYHLQINFKEEAN